jgi:hypothetical protein
MQVPIAGSLPFCNNYVGSLGSLLGNRKSALCAFMTKTLPAFYFFEKTVGSTYPYYKKR